MLRLIEGALVIVLIIPTAIIAQDTSFRSLSDYMQLPDDRRDAAYPFIRCTGLFRGLFRYGGASFSDEVMQRTQLGNDAMMYVAFTLRKEKHPEWKDEDIAKQMGSEIENIEFIYAERMEKNYSLTGEAYGSDEVITIDFELCGDVVQLSIDAVRN
jgi:hypothetical protein